MNEYYGLHIDGHIVYIGIFDHIVQAMDYYDGNHEPGDIIWFMDIKSMTNLRDEINLHLKVGL